MLYSVVREPRQTGPNPAPTLVLLHGLGADENDLLGLAPYLDPRLRIESVRAPKTSPWGGYSWFDIDFDAQGLSIDQIDARRSLDALLDFLSGRSESPLLVAGFSQGAMMALGVLLEKPEWVSGVVAMSGALLPSFEPSKEGKGSALLTHGTSDPVVPVEEGRRAAEALEQIGVDVEYREYPMQHEISADCVRDIDDWLKAKIESLAR